jgi:amino acid transporter
VWALAAANIREGTRVLLVIEATTVALILIVSVVILIRLATGTAPNGNTLDFSVFSIPGGTGTSAVFLGVVFGFLSFAGFEAAATLGEEAQEPRRDIPRAILGVAIFGGLYYVFVSAVEMMGFGTDAKGVENFIASGSLLGDLGSQFVAGWVGELITIGAAVSAFGCALACVVGAARMLYALSRDEVGPVALGTVSSRTGVPARSTAGIAIATYVMIALGWFVFRVAPFDLFVASGTIGTLMLLVVYALATIGAARLLIFSGERQVAAWEVVVPFLALLVIGYTLFRNVYPYPTDAARWYPIIATVWIVAGILLTFVRYAATQRAGERLMAEEGLASGTGSRTGDYR